jgi:hypothetical protein
MLQTQAPSPGLLFASYLYQESCTHQKTLIKNWEDLFGSSFIFFPSFNPLTNYYSSEMGDATHLKRFFILSSTPSSRESLLSAKLRSLKMEEEQSYNGKRMVNIDPGLLTLENLVLSTTKNYSHRIYLGDHIFGDLTYQFQHGKYVTLPWTYPDYMDEEKISFFTWGRSYLHSVMSRAK